MGFLEFRNVIGAVATIKMFVGCQAIWALCVGMTSIIHLSNCLQKFHTIAVSLSLFMPQRQEKDRFN